MTVGPLDAPSPALVGRVTAVTGPAAFRLAHRWFPGGSEVWRVDGARGAFALKIHRERTGYERERAAYRDRLPASKGVPAPRLLAAFDDERPALLLGWAEGRTFDRIPFSSVGADAAVFEAAGRALRALHAIPVTGEEADAVRRGARDRIVRRVERLRDALPADVAAWAREVAGRSAWARFAVGWCHRDFSPRNWVVAEPEGPAVTLLDFEFATADFLAADAMKLWDGPFVGRPDRRAAFHAGYGLRPEDDAAARRAVAAIHGLSVLDWSLRMGQPDYAAHGLSFLRRVAGRADWADD